MVPHIFKRPLIAKHKPLHELHYPKAKEWIILQNNRHRNRALREDKKIVSGVKFFLMYRNTAFLEGITKSLRKEDLKTEYM